jgi:hypothetical protein
MRKILAVWILAYLTLMLVGCTDAKLKQLTTLGSPGEIKCYSGGKEIYTGKSTGKIATEQGSDGWYFQEAGTNQLVRVSGDCVIRN